MNEADREEVRQIIREQFASSVDWPSEFKNSLGPWLEISGMRLPISQIDGVYVVADTVDGLGPGVHGRTGVIRGGTTPFDFLKVTYDAEYGKWVSDPFPLLQHGSRNGPGFWTDSTSFVTVTDTNETIYPCAVWEDAGLRAQFRFYVGLNATSGQTATGSFSIAGADHGDNSVTLFGFAGTSEEIAHVSSGTGALYQGDWLSLSGAMAKDFISAVLSLKTSGGTAVMNWATVILRWVSA